MEHLWRLDSIFENAAFHTDFQYTITCEAYMHTLGSVLAGKLTAACMYLFQGAQVLTPYGSFGPMSHFCISKYKPEKIFSG